jgi:hypothetical protein
LPVLVRYGSNTIVRPYTELAPAEKRALMRKVWLALLQALTNPEQDVARADYPAWNPVPEDCHLNARRWLAAYPGFELTRGWLHQPSAHGQGSFIPHTVVRDRNGMLRDVTRLAQAVPLRFIPHPTDDVEFDQLVHAAPHCVTELAIGNDEQP